MHASRPAHATTRLCPPTVRLLGAAAILVSLLLGGCGVSARQTTNATLPAIVVSSLVPSPQGSTHYSTMSITALNPGSGSVLWSYQTDVHPWHRPTAPGVADGVVYALSDPVPTTDLSTGTQSLPGDLVALRERDGRQLWRVHVGFLASPPVVSNGVVYVGAVSASAPGQQATSFYALRASDGKQVWRSDLTALMTAQSTVEQGFGVVDIMQLVDGVLYVTSNQICFDSCNAAYLLALRASDGKQLWKIAIKGNITIYPPTIADGRVFVSVPYDASQPALRDTAVIAAYNAQDGKPVWTASGFTLGSPLVAGGTVHALLFSQHDPSNADSPWTTTVVALDEGSGSPRWRLTADVDDTDTLNAMLGATTDTVFVQSRSVAPSGSVSWSLSGLNTRDGTVRWRMPLPARLGPALLAGGIFYGITGDTRQRPKVAAVNTGDGHAAWSVSLPPPPAGPDYGPTELLALGSGVLYTAYTGLDNNRFMLMPIRTADGTVLWSVPGNGVLGGVTVVP